MSTTYEKSASLIFVTGCISLLFGSLILIFGAVAWGAIEFPLSILKDQSETKISIKINELIKIVGIVATVLGTIMFIFGMGICCTLLFFIVHTKIRFNPRSKASLLAERDTTIESFDHLYKNLEYQPRVHVSGDRPIYPYTGPECTRLVPAGPAMMSPKLPFNEYTNDQKYNFRKDGRKTTTVNFEQGLANSTMTRLSSTGLSSGISTLVPEPISHEGTLEPNKSIDIILSEGRGDGGGSSVVMSSVSEQDELRNSRVSVNCRSDLAIPSIGISTANLNVNSRVNSNYGTV